MIIRERQKEEKGVKLTWCGEEERLCLFLRVEVWMKDEEKIMATEDRSEENES